MIFLLGLGILFYPHVTQYQTKRAQFNEVVEMKEEFKLVSESEKEEQLTGVQSCNDAIFKNEEGLEDPFTFGFDRNHYEQCDDSPGPGEKVGALEVPTLDLNIPIFIGTTETELTQGVGQVDGSSLPFGGVNTHTVLAGHRGMWTKAMFRNLDEVETGDVFYLHTVSGKLAYNVYDVDIVRPFATDSLGIVEGQDRASLITCHPYGSNTHRLIVYGERVEEE